MAYSTPSTRSTSDTITEAIWDADIYDTREFMHKSPAALVYRSSAQTISNSSDTAITFDSETYDTDSIHSTSTNTSRLTCQTAGLYVIWGQVQWASVAGASGRELKIRLNNGNYIAYSASEASNLVYRQSVATVYKLAASDYVDLVVLQNSGGNLDVEYSATFPPKFGMMWIGSGSSGV